MMRRDRRYDIIVIGGGHAGAEAAWAAAHMLSASAGRVALITMDPRKVGAMSCNPAIGGLAKGQMVREIDALGGLMALAADATGIQFRILNASKGPAVHGPRCQSDKYAYAREVQRLLGTLSNLTTLAGTVEHIAVEQGKVQGVWYRADVDYHAPRESADCCGEFGSIDAAEKPVLLQASAVVLTTGTFMRALMHTGERKTEGGRVNEGSAVSISAALRDLGFDLGRLKTGTPPRLAAETIDFASLQPQPGDEHPVPFSDMTGSAASSASNASLPRYEKVASRFPVIEQRPCHITHTSKAIHDLIRSNLHRAPMFNGQIETQGPRYCPSIEDKVVRFADRDSHHIFLEPESLETNEIYCNGISTSLPADVQQAIVHQLPGCEHARILRMGYAVEYDMVWPHQIDATAMTKLVEGLFLAGQINGTSGYEEAAGQGLIAGINAVRYARSQPMLRLRRDQAYIGVLLDDLVTRTPREPYRMFTSRAEHRLLLRSDNADERLTPLGRELGLVDDARWQAFQARSQAIAAVKEFIQQQKVDKVKLADWLRRPEVTLEAFVQLLRGDARLPEAAKEPRLAARVLADVQYEAFIEREKREVARLEAAEATPLPAHFRYSGITGLRREAANVLEKFQPATLGQAGRLAGVTPADVMLLAVALKR